MKKVRKLNDGLANAKAIIENELTKILLKTDIDPSDRNFTLQAFKLLTDEQQAQGKAPARPLAKEDEEELLKLIGS